MRDFRGDSHSLAFGVVRSMIGRCPDVAVRGPATIVGGATGCVLSRRGQPGHSQEVVRRRRHFTLLANLPAADELAPRHGAPGADGH